MHLFLKGYCNCKWEFSNLVCMFPYQAAYSFHGAVLSKSLSFKYIKSVTPRGPGNMVLVDLHVNDVIHLFSFLFGCAGSSLLCSLVVAQELLIAVTSLIAEHSSGARGLSGCGAYGLRCPVVRGLLPDRGRNPRPVHWRADSQPLGHEGRSCAISFTRAELSCSFSSPGLQY